MTFSDIIFFFRDLQKVKDVKEKMKHLANLIDKKADMENIKKIQG